MRIDSRTLQIPADQTIRAAPASAAFFALADAAAVLWHQAKPAALWLLF
jgi:hypothetical protein